MSSDNLSASESSAIAESADQSLPAWALLNWSHAVGALILCGIAILISVFSLWHTDIWAHVQFGRWMLDHNAFPDKEPFTPYSDPEQKIPQAWWLTQVLYAWTIDAGAQLTHSSDPVRRLQGSVQLLLILHLFVMIAFWIFIWLAYRRIGGSITWANLALLVTFAGLLGPSAFQRPQMFGMLGFAMLLYALSKPEISRKTVWLLPLVMAFWANLHGSFAAGLLFLGMIVLTRLVSLRLADRQRSWRSLFADPQLQRPLLALTLSIVAVGCLNPHGPMLYWHVATFGSRPNLRMLNEWTRIGLKPGEEGFWPFAISVGVVLVFWLASGCARFGLFATALPFALFPLIQQRMMTWWLPLAGWLLAALGPVVVEKWRLARWIPALPPSPVATVLAGLFVFVALCFMPPLHWLIKGPRGLDQSLSHATCWQLGLELNAAPEQRGRWLPKFKEAMRGYPDGRFTGAIFPTETLGEYLIYVTPAEYPVLVYGHAHLFPAAHFQQCMDVKYARGDWRGWLAERKVNMVVIEPDRHVDLANQLRRDPDWIVVLDEANASGARRPGDRQFIAVRRRPL